MSNVYIDRFKHSAPRDVLSELKEAVSEVIYSRDLDTKEVSKLAFATESLQDQDQTRLTRVFNSIETSLKVISQKLGLSIEEDSSSFDSRVTAASIAGIISADPVGFCGASFSAVNASTENYVVQPNVSDGGMKRQISMEAYDERDNKKSQLYSIIYNLGAARQDEFSETFFPTIVISPDQAGAAVEIKLFYVYQDSKRAITGALYDFQRRNVLRAYVDSTILKNDQTLVVPVVRPSSVASFVDVADVPSYLYNLEGYSIPTAPLKCGQKIDILGLSQHDELVSSGLMGPADSLDTFAQLKNIFVKFTDGVNTDIIRFVVEDLPTSIFTYVPVGNSRNMQLSFNSNSVLLTPQTTKVDGTPLTFLTEVSASNFNVRLDVLASGTTNLQGADTVVFGNKVEAYIIRDSMGNIVSSSVVPGSTLVDKIKTGVIIGYEMTAYRANLNRRQRGQLTDTQTFMEIINIPFRAPVSSIMPVTDVDRNDSTTIQSLVTTTNIRTSNQAVGSLLKAESTLRGYKAVKDHLGVMPDVLGVGRHYVIPTFFEETIDMALIVDSLKSHERNRDFRAAIIEKIRFYAYNMSRDSEYMAADRALSGGVENKPTIVIGTDPVIYNYLMSEGELRTIGDNFNCVLVSSLDARMTGRLIMSFGVFNDTRNTQINPLNFGNMLWSPEVTVVLPISRNGEHNKELTVSPRFLHLINLPIMTSLRINNIPSVTKKVTVNFHNL